MQNRVVVLGIHPRTNDTPRFVVGQVYGLGDTKAKRRVRVILEPTLPSRQERIEVGKYWVDQRRDVPSQRDRAAAWVRSIGAPLALKLTLAGTGLASGVAGGYLLHERCGAAEGCAQATKICTSRFEIDCD
jgi:hypothetical protein